MLPMSPYRRVNIFLAFPSILVQSTSETHKTRLTEHIGNTQNTSYRAHRKHTKHVLQSTSETHKTRLTEPVTSALVCANDVETGLELFFSKGPTIKNNNQKINVITHIQQQTQPK